MEPLPSIIMQFSNTRSHIHSKTYLQSQGFGGPPARLKTWNSMDNAFRMLASSLQRKLDPGVRELQITVNNVSAPRVHSLKAPTRNPLHGQSCAMEGAIAFTSQRLLKPTCGCRARPHKDLEIASLLHSRGLSFGVQRA